MTVYALPTLPTVWVARPKLRDFNGRLTPPLGGEEQRIRRLGSRFSVEMQILPLCQDMAGALLGIILKAATNGATVTAAWPQEAGSAHGTPKVNGGSQSGTSLVVDGLSSATIKAGTFFSFSVSSHTYLHMVTDDVTPSGGAATLTIAPMLRASPLDNADLEFASPQIEGFLSDEASEWTLEMLMARSFNLRIEENK